MKYILTLFILISLFSFSCAFQNTGTPIEHILLPEGFRIKVYAHVPNARSLALGSNGVVYVGNRSGDKVYAIVDSDKNGEGDDVFVIDEGLHMPNGVAFKDGDLYVAEVSRILRYENIEIHLKNPPEPEVVYDRFPTDTHHGWKYIAFGPDGKLYVPVGAPCNVCEEENEIYATITRLDVDNPKPEVIAKGVRNSVGFDWDPDTGDLWFTDNGRDMMGDDIPPCELNHLHNIGEHFGFPYCHGGAIPDPSFGAQRNCNEFVKPAWTFNAHVAPLGVKFYTGDMFPEEYKKAVFIAQHGSWNRSEKIGYRIMVGFKEGNKITSMKVFATGWLNDSTQRAWGRPVDLLPMPDGSLLLSDDSAGVVYRITYNP